MWVIVVALTVVVATWWAGVDRFAFLAMVHDSLPVMLSLAWVVGVYALVTDEWPLAAAAAVFVGVHLAVVLPPLARGPVPVWAAAAPRLSVVLANVFVDNRTPARAATALLHTDADILVVAEWNDGFMTGFRDSGGDESYPFRIDGPTDRPDYAMTIASRVPLRPESTVVQAGALVAIQAVIDCGGRPVTVLGVHLSALLAPGGFHAWRREIHELGELLPTLVPPFVVVGDFNSSRFRPEFARFVRRAGLTNVHDRVGKGLTRSLKLSGRGLLASVPAFTRVDHALLSPGVHVLDVANLAPMGSDHHPFVATLAVHPESSRAGDDVPVARTD
jgi:endonuclease/exonuclease/phosphatase (EEP) superfamily protein YafD